MPNYQPALWMARLAQVRTNQQTAVLLQGRPMFPPGCSHRKPELSYQHHSDSAGPCRQLSSGQWALSELRSIELADIDWKYESEPARSHRLQPLRGIRCSLENQKCSSHDRLQLLPILQTVLSMVWLPQPVPLCLAQVRTIRQAAVPLQMGPMFPPG